MLPRVPPRLFLREREGGQGHVMVPSFNGNKEMPGMALGKSGPFVSDNRKWMV